MGQAVDNLLRYMVHLRSHYNGAYIPHVVGNGEAKDQHQHHGHDKKDEHRATVANDVLSFLDDKRRKLLHTLKGFKN